MNEPWICPRCGRVYSPMLFECSACNRVIREREELVQGAERMRPEDAEDMP